ncbi:MAG: Crp/Fnr family transcriptional regulator [Bacteroidia bacterium]
MDDPQQLARFFDVFFTYVRILVDIPESDQVLCRENFRPKVLKKNSMIAQSATIHEHHNFIVSGHARNFHVDDDGKEITTDINDGPRFFTSFHHFMNRTVSNESLHCITDCEVLQIKRDDMDRMAEVGITQVDYSLQILQQHLEKDKQRIIDLATLSAEERYLKLMQNHPTIIQNVPLKYIASYLGIKAGSLSRIRQNIG